MPAQSFREFLNRGADHQWERTGIAVGLVACISIAIQLFHEWASPHPTSLSWFFLIGFAGVYTFWFFYGVKFNHPGVWLPNGIASILQALLVVCVLLKGGVLG
jgi:uncharacterized protein with PQ loop repeat